MPNPLMRTGTPKTAEPHAVVDPSPSDEALRPLVESVQGGRFNNPYRGMEDHGIDPTGQLNPPPDYDGVADEEYDEPEPPIDPIAVYVVNPAGRTDKHFRVNVAYAMPGGTLVIGQDETRTGVRLHNASGSIVYISSRPEMASAADGWPIGANAEMALETMDAIYAGTAAMNSDPAKLVILSEYSA